jgi:hypothetical protein
LIHKETEVIITYDEWLEKLEENDLFIIHHENNNGYWSYSAKLILFNNDFDIIYDSELKFNEMLEIYNNSSADLVTKTKAYLILKEKKKLMEKFKLDL